VNQRERGAWNVRDWKVQSGSFREVDLTAGHRGKWSLEGGGGFKVWWVEKS